MDMKVTLFHYTFIKITLADKQINLCCIINTDSSDFAFVFIPETFLQKQMLLKIILKYCWIYR